jgi:hypothetical protein
MTIEQKLDSLYNAVNKAWDDAFEGWEWDEPQNKSSPYVLGEKHPENGYAFFLGVNEYHWGGCIWIEYEPEKNIVGIYIKDRPIKDYLIDDLKNLFEKYSPFDMKVSFTRKTTPIISKKEKVEPENFLNFFKEFRTAYKEYYPLFYMFTFSAKELYDGYCVVSGDC